MEDKNKGHVSRALGYKSINKWAIAEKGKLNKLLSVVT